MNLAAELAAAITDGSSMDIGMLICRPFILKNKLKLNYYPKPKGKDIFPIQFSTMRLAWDRVRPPDSKFSTFISTY